MYPSARTRHLRTKELCHPVERMDQMMFRRICAIAVAVVLTAPIFAWSDVAEAGGLFCRKKRCCCPPPVVYCDPCTPAPTGVTPGEATVPPAGGSPFADLREGGEGSVTVQQTESVITEPANKPVK